MNVIDTTEGCRYCLMCRHICPVTRVTYNEASSPHGWALAIASVKRGLLAWDAETSDLLYQCADCGACQAFCVTDQPLPQAIVAARAQVVAAGQAPPAVAELEAALRRWGNPSGPAEAPAPAQAELALLVGTAAWQGERAQAEAALALIGQAAGPAALIAAGRDSGYLPYTLGLTDTARALAQQTADEIAGSGCRLLLTLEPEQAHTLRTIYPALGVALPAGVEVIELTTWLAQQLEAGRLNVQPAQLALAYHDPCHTPRLGERWRAPRTLLAAIAGEPPRVGFWREARAASCGASGGLPFTQPGLAGQLARRALDDLAADAARTIVTDSPGCLAHLRAHAAPGVAVTGLYALLAEHVVRSSI